MGKRKLLIFTDTHNGTISGVQTSILELIKHCNTTQVDVVSPDHFYTIDCPTYDEVKLSLVTPHYIQRLIREKKPDYIHIATEATIGFAAARACQKMNIPYTSAFHTKIPEYIHVRSRLIKEKWIHQALHYIHKSADTILVSSDSMKRYLTINNYPKEKISILPFGVDRSVFSPGQKTLFHDLPKPIFLFVGRVAIEKNIEDFLNMYVGGTKVVVGDGPLRADLYRRFPEVYFLGYRDKNSLVEIYRSSDIFVFPSLTDTLGLVIIEALACGLPVLAYDVDGPNVVIQNGYNGILVPYGTPLQSGIEQVLKIRKHACIMSAEKYDWREYAQNFVNVQIPILNKF